MQTKAAVLYEQGRRRPYTQSQPLAIEIVDLDDPEDGELLVEIAAAGLCHSDLSTITPASTASPMATWCARS